MVDRDAEGRRASSLSRGRRKKHCFTVCLFLLVLGDNPDGLLEKTAKLPVRRLESGARGGCYVTYALRDEIVTLNTKLDVQSGASAQRYGITNRGGSVT